VLKPSELAPHCAELLGELVPKYLDPRAVRLVQGAVPGEPSTQVSGSSVGYLVVTHCAPRYKQQHVV
jgi:hypothetical protein